MANFFDQFDGGSSGGRIEVRPSSGGPSDASRAGITAIESGGRYDLVGPVTRNGDRAVGKYQVMGRNIPEWTREALGREMSVPEFRASPEAQDAVFNHRFGMYEKKYGPAGAARAWFAGEGGMNDYGRKDVLGTSVADYERMFNAHVKKSGAGDAMAFAQPQKAAAPAANFFDQFDSPAQSGGQAAVQPSPVEARFPEEQQNPALAGQLQTAARGMTTGPEQPSTTQMTTDFLNQGPAASQGTTPNVDAHYKNLISDQVFENDAGQVMYKDPATGKVVPTDQNKHIAMRDPKDGRVKVFARTADTDEGRISAAGRLLISGMGAGAATSRPAIGVKAALKPGQEVTQAAQRIGVDVPKAVASDSMTAQRTAATLRNVPGAGNPLVKSAEKTLTQLGDAATDVASGYGGGTVVGAGEAAKTGIQNYVVKTTADRATKLYDAVDQFIDPSVTVPLRNTGNASFKILGGREAAAQGAGSEALGVVKEALARPGGLTYEGIKKLREGVGEMLANPSMLPAGTSQKELKLIYGGLSADLKDAARAAGGTQGLAAFERANKYYALVSARREQLAKIVGVNAAEPAEKVFDKLVAKAGSSARADIEALTQARKAVGAENWNEVAAGVVGRLGRDVEGKFSPDRFITDYNKLSAAGKALLFKSGGKGELAQSLDDIAKVSSRFKSLNKFANPSGTGQAAIGATIIGSAGYGVMNGDWETPLKVIAVAIGGRGVAAALARPATAASVARWMRSYEQLAKQPSAPKLAMLEMASRNLITNLKDVGVSNVSPADFLKALQSPGKAAADQQEVPRPPGQ